MVFKKINAGLSLLTVAVLLVHIGISFRTLEGVEVPMADIVPTITMILVITHALLSMMIILFINDGSDMKYAKLNVSSVIQRASGILLLIPLFVSHRMVYTTADMQTPLHAAVEIAFFVLVNAHIATSLPKALITLGIVQKDKAVKIISIAAIVAAAVLTVDAVLMVIRTILVG